MLKTKSKKTTNTHFSINEREVLLENKLVMSVLLLVQMASVYFYHYKSLTVGIILNPISCFVFIEIITVLDINYSVHMKRLY